MLSGKQLTSTILDLVNRARIEMRMSRLKKPLRGILESAHQDVLAHSLKVGVLLDHDNYHLRYLHDIARPAHLPERGAALGHAWSGTDGWLICQLS